MSGARDVLNSFGHRVRRTSISYLQLSLSSRLAGAVARLAWVMPVFKLHHTG
jgi:hypothetical protein